MKRVVVLTYLLLILTLLAGAEEFSGVYSKASDIFEPDPNVGMTVFPTLLVPMGGKYEGMGTAYTAVGKDSSFIAANPSASSSLKYTELSFLHNNWIADSNMEGVIYTIRFNDLGIGIGGQFLYDSFTEYDDWGERGGRGYYSESIGTLNISYNFFSSYYFYGFAVGGNIKVAYRHIPETIYPEQSVLTALMDIGVLSRFNVLKLYASRSRNFSVGAVMKNLGPLVLNEPPPTEATFGIAYSPIRPMTIAIDFILPISFWPDQYPAEKWSLAGGIDVVFTNFFSVHGGFRHRGANPRITIGSSIDLKQVNIIANYTLGLETQFNNLDRFSIEAKMKLGDRGRGELRSRVDELYIAGLEAYAKGNLEEAIDYWERVLGLDPHFQPAEEFLQTARQFLSLQREMEEIQQVE